MSNKETALYANHQRRNGKIISFGGFSLPVWFSSIKEEHDAVRNNCGAFDISHMGLLRISGEESQEFLQTITCNDVEKSLNGKMVYSMVLDQNGGILDDIMFGYHADEFYVVVNASNKEKIVNWMERYRPDSVAVEDLNLSHSFIAIQGPKAVETLSSIFHHDFSGHSRFSIQKTTLLNVPVYACRTGYTGEDGFELIIPHQSVEKLWDVILDAGVKPCGLGARDTLRMEMALPLYGQEFNESIHPFMTRYPWVVKMDKAFIGRDALVILKEEPALATVGLQMIDRAIPRSHYPILEGGEITSGTLSPTLDRPIAMALVKPEYAELGAEVTVDIRGKHHKAIVIELPFIKR